MKLFYKMFIFMMLTVSINVFCFIGDIVRGVGQTASNVVEGATHVAADTVDAVTDPYYYSDDYYYDRGPRYYSYEYPRNYRRYNSRPVYYYY